MVYPNPNNGEFILTGVEIGVKYEVFNAEEKLIQTNTVNEPSEPVKLAKVAAGVYFITTLNKDGEKNLSSLSLRASNSINIYHIPIS